MTLRRAALALTLAFAFAATAAAQPACIAFSDNFESGVLGPVWQSGSGSYVRSVTSADPAVGSYSLEQSLTGPSPHREGLYALFAASQPSSVEWWFKRDSSGVARGYFVLGDANIANDNGILFAYVSSTDELRFYNGTGVNLSVTADVWHHVEVTDIDWTARTMDVSVDGVPITALTDWAFRSGTATSVDRVHLYSLDGPSTAYYDDIRIGQTQPRVSSVALGHPACPGQATGSIDITISAEAAVTGITWSTGATTEDLTGLAAGTYGVSITDANGCTGHDTFTLFDPLAITVDGTVTADSGGDSGSIDLTVGGGTGAFTFLWSNGATTEDVSGLSAGPYSVTVEDANGCQTTASFDVADQHPVPAVGPGLLVLLTLLLAIAGLKALR